MHPSKNKKYCSSLQRVFEAVLIGFMSVSIGFGNTASNYIAIEANQPPKPEPKTVYVEGGSHEAITYANQILEIYARRLSDEELKGRIEVQSGYGCQFQACISISYEIDGLEIREAINNSSNIVPGTAGSFGASPSKKPQANIPADEPSASARNRLETAKSRYQMAQDRYDRVARNLAETNSRLNEANRDLSNMTSELKANEVRLNAAIADMNRYAQEAIVAGNRASIAAQNASDKRTQLARLEKYQQQAASEKEALSVGLAKLEQEVAEAIVHTKSFAEASFLKAENDFGVFSAERRNQSGAVFTSHNQAASSLSNSLSLEQDISALNPDKIIEEGQVFKSSPASVGGQKVRDTDVYLIATQRTLQNLPADQREPGERILPAARSALYSADRAYANGDFERGDFSVRLASSLVDLAIGIAPIVILVAAPEALALFTAASGIALAKDWYESWSGTELLTGEPLSAFSRSLSVLGVATAIVPFAASAKAGVQGLSKAVGFTEEFLSIGKSADEVAEIVKAAEGASEIIISAVRTGASTADEVSEFAGVLSKYKIDLPNWPDKISFNKDLKLHMSSLDSFTQKSGVTGAHNARKFENVVMERNLRITMTRNHPTINGLKDIEYQIPKLDRTGAFTGEYKGKFIKTVYDPNVLTDNEVLRLGQIASIEGYEAAISSANVRIYAGNAAGIDFTIYLENGVITNVHPRLPQ